MKRLQYIALTTLCLTACHHDEAVDVSRPVDSSTPIKVAGALSKNETTRVAPTSPANDLQTRAAMKGLDGTNGWEKKDQFVVNAHYYYSTTTTLAQDFMVDTPVTYTTSGTSWYGTTNYWDYSPIKYWPQQGYLDFFAVYPRDYYDNNLDRQRLFHEELDRTVIKTRFYLDVPGKHDADDKATDAIEQWDLMFSHRPHLSKPDVTTPVKFTFSHAEMAIRFWAGELNLGNNAVCIIDSISLDNIHSGGLITAFDITDWQAYYAQFGNQGVITNTAEATTPVKLEYTWDWTSDPILHPDRRGTYTQDMSFDWSYVEPGQQPQINPDDKVFIIPPQCIGDPNGSSITIYYRTHDAGGAETLRTHTIKQEFCGEPGKVLDIILGTTIPDTENEYEIEVITATLTPWEDITGSVITDLEK